jgi:hypothetical protein
MHTPLPEVFSLWIGYPFADGVAKHLHVVMGKHRGCEDRNRVIIA